MFERPWYEEEFNFEQTKHEDKRQVKETEQKAAHQGRLSFACNFHYHLGE